MCSLLGSRVEIHLQITYNYCKGNVNGFANDDLLSVLPPTKMTMSANIIRSFQTANRDIGSLWQPMVLIKNLLMTPNLSTIFGFAVVLHIYHYQKTVALSNCLYM